MAPTATPEAAIAAALSSNWKEAIRINTIILKEDATNIAALNRLGYAYAQDGQKTRAKTTLEKVLVLDPYNQIALKHIKNIGAIKKGARPPGSGNHVSPLSFLAEPGVTKIVACVNLAPAQTIAVLTPGMEVILKPRSHGVEIRVPPNTYVAALPDDLSFKLLKLIASGNRYQAIVRGVSKKSLILMLREVSRGTKFAGQPSFISPALPVSSGIHPGAASADTDGGADHSEESSEEE